MTRRQPRGTIGMHQEANGLHGHQDRDSIPSQKPQCIYTPPHVSETLITNIAPNTCHSQYLT